MIRLTKKQILDMHETLIRQSRTSNLEGKKNII